MKLTTEMLKKLIKEELGKMDPRAGRASGMKGSDDPMVKRALESLGTLMKNRLKDPSLDDRTARAIYRQSIEDIKNGMATFALDSWTLGVMKAANRDKIGKEKVRGKAKKIRDMVFGAERVEPEEPFNRRI